MSKQYIEETPVPLQRELDGTAELLREQQTQQQEMPQPPTAIEGNVALFPPNDLEGLRGRWKEIQAGFVDEPRMTVQKADQLVADVIRRLTEVFANERGRLEKDWGHAGDVSTEDLRQALRHYRSFFDRLLSV